MAKEPGDYFDFRRATLTGKPFPHFAVSRFVDVSLAADLLAWFETDAPWSPHNEEGFYQSYDLCLRGSDLPARLEGLVSRALTEYVRSEVSRVFDAQLSERVDVTAHKLIPSYQIGIHTDHGDTQQTHRLLVQIN